MFDTILIFKEFTIQCQRQKETSKLCVKHHKVPKSLEEVTKYPEGKIRIKQVKSRRRVIQAEGLSCLKAEK